MLLRELREELDKIEEEVGTDMIDICVLQGDGEEDILDINEATLVNSEDEIPYIGLFV